MSETDSKMGPSIGSLHEVRARFRSPDEMQIAVGQTRGVRL